MRAPPDNLTSYVLFILSLLIGLQGSVMTVLSPYLPPVVSTFSLICGEIQLASAAFLYCVWLNRVCQWDRTTLFSQYPMPLKQSVRTSGSILVMGIVLYFLSDEFLYTLFGLVLMHLVAACIAGCFIYFAIKYLGSPKPSSRDSH